MPKVIHRQKLRFQLTAIGLLLAITSGCNQPDSAITANQSKKEPEKNLPTLTTQVGQPTSSEAATSKQSPAITANNASPSKDHYYSLRDEQRYGYEQQLSEIDKAQGMTAKPLVMIYFFGLQENVYQVAFGNPMNAPVEIAECSKPCEFIKMRRAPPTSLAESSENIRSEKGSILWVIMQDAMNGKLERAFIMDKTLKFEGVEVGQTVPSVLEKHYFRVIGPTLQIIPESKLATK